MPHNENKILTDPIRIDYIFSDEYRFFITFEKHLVNKAKSFDPLMIKMSLRQSTPNINFTMMHASKRGREEFMVECDPGCYKCLKPN